VSDTPCTLEPKVSLPPRFRAGDQLAWNLQLDLNVFAAGTKVFYVLTGVIGNVPVRIFIPAGAQPANGIAIDDTGLAAFTLASTDTAGWQPGRYQWVLFAVDSSNNRTELAQGEITIVADPNGALPADPRTDNEKLLHQVKCLLNGKAENDVQMYKIGQRELTKMTLDELLKWEGILAVRVRKERERRGEKVRTKTVGILFGGR